MTTDLGKLTLDWKDVKSVYLFGAGFVSNVCKPLFSKIDIHIEGVIDNDVLKQGQEWNGIKIQAYDSVKNRLEGKKIIVMAARTAYNSIATFLSTQGLIEFRDFCRIGHFLSEWMWDVKGLNCIYHVDMTITSRCTFNCKNCNMFIPYYNEHKDFDIEELKNNMDLFFERVDYVAWFGLIGGETLIYTKLKELIDYLYLHYSDRFATLTLTTNGTVMPNEALLKSLKRDNILVEISDYTKAVDYVQRFTEIQRAFDDNDVRYEILSSSVWTDFGFPTYPKKYTERQLEEHLKCCRPDWNGLNSGRFYYCNVSWSAEKSGRFKLEETDSIDLMSIDPIDRKECRRLVSLSRGTSSFCKVCGGCGRDNRDYVPVGVQL
ncbi:MAG: radical SAM protein [Lachnospiraceae bacterium]|nr:radical SAM protein [Lachnospiraceae bacterium]